MTYEDMHEYRIDWLAGQLNGLKCFVSAIIRTHPDATLLNAYFQRAAQIEEAMSTPMPISEAFLQGQRQMRGDIEALLLTAAE